MISLLFFGLIGLVIMIIYKNRIGEHLAKNNSLVNQLGQRHWFQNQWLAGLSLFGLNAVLFFLTGGVLYGLMFLLIPYIHLVIMILAVIVSIYLWVVINKAWEGSKVNRLKLGAVGSSFYLILTIVSIFMMITLEPQYPGEDTFMRFIGLFFSGFVTAVAFFTCFFITGFSKSRKN
ncbi:hypothetical protein CJ195_03705 [Bacillus sp. UMB0899]|uniref:hypothetical protein n=1 Tax=Metabacillus schmidteae TaxID=2730405 RepID=UPI000C7FEE54|nr:hypothetical protein [Metabacillus schmidteae]PMC39056.1 hypothetical protein CJ195_03705 [Bacillus sp. UMB0899]